MRRLLLPIGWLLIIITHSTVQPSRSQGLLQVAGGPFNYSDTASPGTVVLFLWKGESDSRDPVSFTLRERNYQFLILGSLPASRLRATVRAYTFDLTQDPTRVVSFPQHFSGSEGAEIFTMGR